MTFLLQNVISELDDFVERTDKTKIMTFKLFRPIYPCQGERLANYIRGNLIHRICG